MAGFRKAKAEQATYKFLQAVAMYYNGYSTRMVAELWGISQTQLRRIFSRNDIPTRSLSEARLVALRHGRLDQSRDKNHAWKGGRTTSGKGGYVWIKLRGHPRANTSGYVREHILILEEKIGRSLLPNEVCHHIDGDVTNNKPENLEVMTNSTHTSLHRQTRKEIAT